MWRQRGVILPDSIIAWTAALSVNAVDGCPNGTPQNSNKRRIGCNCQTPDEPPFISASVVCSIMVVVFLILNKTATLKTVMVLQ